MTELYLGLLSGTSMDAIDVAAVDCSDSQARVIHALNVPLPDSYKDQYLNIIQTGTCSLSQLGELDHWTGELFADAVLQFLKHYKINKSQICAIGSHGQTIWHAPNAVRPFSMQLGNPHLIAAKTGITTVADFRRSDMAAGGQGAPLAPLFHREIFANAQQPRCIVNIGGIANVTILDGQNILGFDTGPGNCLIDLSAKKYFGLDYDKHGSIAKSGHVNQALLRQLLQDPYFQRKPPKSTGREYFNQNWLPDVALDPADLIATLTQLSAQTIADAILNYAPPTAEVYLCGGGAHNEFLRSVISAAIKRDVATTATLGVDPDWVEACLFAWLAKNTVTNRILEAGNVTGATQPYIAGSMVKA